MRAILTTLLSKIKGPATNTDAQEALLVVGSLLEKAYIHNADDTYRQEILGEEFRNVSLHPDEIQEVFSMLNESLLAGPSFSTSQVLWAIGKAPSVESLNLIARFLQRTKDELWEDAYYQALISLENVVLDNRVNSIAMSQSGVIPVLQELANNGSTRVREVAERLLGYLEDGGELPDKSFP